MSADPLARPARLARRIPGYTRIRRVLVPRVRESAALRRMAERLWLTPQAAADGRGIQLTAGNLIGGVGRQGLPIVLVDVRRHDGEDLARLVGEIARLQLLTAGFRPVIVQSHADFSAARRYGFPVELMDVLAENNSAKDILVPTWAALRSTYGTALFMELSEAELTAVRRAMLLSLAAH